MIEPRSYEEPKLKELISVLIEWINDELADHRIIVKDLEEDLYDGQILQKLFGKSYVHRNRHIKKESITKFLFSYRKINF